MKKQTFALFSLIIVSVTMLFNSCSTDNHGSNESDVSTNVSENSSLISRVNVLTPENTRNPYDEVGIMHNVVIERVMTNASNLVTTDDYINYAKAVSNDIYGINSSNTVIPTNAQIKTIINDHSADFNNVIANSGYSSNGKSKLTELVNLLLEADSDLTIDYNTLKRQIILFEDNLISDTSILPYEKQNILQMASVARYSTYFWYNNMLDAIAYNENLTATNAPKKRWWKWAIVGVADLLGGIGGATFGSPTGVVAVGMAIIGAASASGGSATVLNYFWPAPVNVPPSE